RPGRVRDRRLWRLAAVVLLGATLPACSPFYVIRAAYEEGKILWRRQPIVELLEQRELADDTAEKLKLVLAVRDYARDVLRFNVGGSYSSYSYVDRPDLSYIVTAAPQTELKPYTWWFPIVGRIPYKGFFSKEAAHAEAERLKRNGYDTNIRATAAFSTLGWFDDPLLAHLLKYDKVTLADLVFHELFHNTLYVKGAGSFNESVASFVGARAAIDFFRDRSGDESVEYKNAVRAWQEELEFAAFIENLAESLKELYARNIPLEEILRLREEVFAKGKAEWADRISTRPSHRFRYFSMRPLNNAVMIHYLLYMNNLKLFESLYQAEGGNLVRVIDLIREAVPKGREPFATVQALLDKRTSGMTTVR
ncbi:MAG TPA: aminopeptidase, partial [Candidatus Binatia bacterium]|nr:aminopeptidase [Candidatus Binatia bacterium]